MLEVRDLRIAYQGADVVHGVGFGVMDGETVGIIGANGAGKTSILRAICGLVRPSSGGITFDNSSLIGRSPEWIARCGLALVPEGRQIFRSLTVGENLRLAAPRKRGMAEAVETSFDRFPVLRARSDQRADRLSGGEQQQLAIARALLRKPRLLLLDEPSLGLAPKMIDTVYEVLSTLRRDGVTILLVEQNATRTIDFCDRCLVLSGGVVRVAGDRQELRRDSSLLQAYLGRQL